MSVGPVTARACSIVGAMLALLAPRSTVSAQDAADPVVASLAAQLDSAARATGFSGVILLAHGGAKAWDGAYGFADRARRVPNTLATRFNVSSVGKLFTQAAISQLAQNGKLDLGATIDTYLPDYPNADVAKHVTIAMLLTHKSGLQSDVLQPAWLPRLNRNHDYLREFSTDSAAFAPGTRQAYSNAGFIVLGEIVERVSGEDFHDYVASHILGPAEMTSTAYDRQDALTEGTAVGYTHYLEPTGERKTDDVRPSFSVQPNRGSAAGGAYSTAEDLLHFVVARRMGRIPNVSARAPARMLGGSAGFNAVVFEGVRPGYDLIILGNVDPPAASDLLDLALRSASGVMR